MNSALTASNLGDVGVLQEILVPTTKESEKLKEDSEEAGAIIGLTAVPIPAK